MLRLEEGENLPAVRGDARSLPRWSEASLPTPPRPWIQAARLFSRLAAGTKTIVAEVRDNGPGNQPGQSRPRLQALFTSKPKGLGLACPSFAAWPSVWGNVDLASEPGRGVAVRLTLQIWK